MLSARGPFRTFRRQVSGCLAVVVALCLGEWKWANHISGELEEVPQRTNVIGRQRTLAHRYAFSAFASVQATAPTERAQWLERLARTRHELLNGHAQLMAHRRESDGQHQRTQRIQRVLDTATLSHGALLSFGDVMVQRRVENSGGLLSNADLLTFNGLLDRYVGAIDQINVDEIAWAGARMRTLERFQGVGVVVIIGVLSALALLVLRPTAQRMGMLAQSVRDANLQLETQARGLQQSADELEAQNQTLLDQYVEIEQHQSDLEAMQRIIAEREQRYRSVVEAIAEGVILLEDSGDLVAWNSSATRILGVSNEELRARHTLDGAWDLRDEAGRSLAGQRHPLAATLHTGTPCNDLVVSIRCETGDRRWLRLNTRAIVSPGDNGAARRSAVASLVDITQERKDAEQLRLFSVVMQQTEQGIAMSDQDHRITWVNSAWSRAVGYTHEEVLGKSAGDLLHGPNTSAETIDRMQAALRAGESWSGEVLNYTRDDKPLWLEVTMTPLRDGHASITSWVTVQRDVTARKAAERERQQLAAALAVTTDGVGIISVGGGLEFVNQAYARVHQERPRSLIGQPWSQRFPAEEALRIEREIIPQVTKLGAWSGEVTGQRADGTAFPQGLSITLLPTGGLVCVMRDATESKNMERMLRTQATRDELTGLLNRRGFFLAGNEQLADAQRRGVRSVLLFADTDRFKLINDTYGHDAGDRVLQIIATTIRSHLRSTDVVARLGGDEFTALLPDTPLTNAHVVVSKIEQALAQLGEAEGCPSPVTMSIGCAEFDPAEPTTLDVLLREADVALYGKKHQHHRARAA